MATLTRRFPVDVDVERAWARVSDVGSVNELIDFLGEVTLDGDRRVCAMPDGGQLDELIVTVDDARRRLVYSIVDSPFQFSHHSASMQVVDRNGTTEFVWTTDFKPDAIAPALEEAVDAAVVSIERSLAA